jgi:medium-chain acyl-[acyl-carrier-protein] hydrolase
MKRWLRRIGSSEVAALRLVCFPFAGGGAHTYRGWSERLPTCEVFGVVLPGHVGRLNEPLATDLIDTARVIADEIAHSVPAPVILYGHSMGAWLALESARALLGLGHEPAGLIVVGRNGPGHPDPAPKLSRLTDDAFVAEVATRYGGVSAEVAASREIMELFTPVLRADIAMMEQYAAVAEPVLSTCPVLALAGANDPDMTVAGLSAWSSVTHGQFEAATLPGGHFLSDANPHEFFLTVQGWLDRRR